MSKLYTVANLKVQIIIACLLLQYNALCLQQIMTGDYWAQ